MENLQFEIPSKWSNYGDVNWLEHGGIFATADEDSKDCYYIVSWRDVSRELQKDRLIIVGSGYVNISDDWLNWEAIGECYGYTMDGLEELRDIYKAVLACEYYGMHEFGDNEHFTDIHVAINALKNELGYVKTEQREF